MTDWVLRPWRQWLDFSGRATRREYWLFYVQLFAAFFALMFVAGRVAVPAGPNAAAIVVLVAMLLFYLYAFIATLSASVRRLHDHDRTGWLYLITLIPLVGWIFFLIMMLTPGTEGENSYGLDPRERDRTSPETVAGVFS